MIVFVKVVDGVRLVREDEEVAETSADCDDEGSEMEGVEEEESEMNELGEVDFDRSLENETESERADVGECDFVKDRV